jgi:hypothetical protein
MRLCLSVWCVCVAVIAAPSAAAAEIAVLPIKGENGADNVTITELVRQSVVGFGLDVLSSSDTDVVIADSAAFSGTCDTSTSACALQLGGVAGVRRVITGKITATQAQLHLYDVASQAEVDSSFVGIGAWPRCDCCAPTLRWVVCTSASTSPAPPSSSTASRGGAHRR